MKIAEILTSKGYDFSNKKMWKIAMSKALASHSKKVEDTKK